MLDKLLDHIDGERQTIIDLQAAMVSIPALGPTNGGDGERAKADYLKEYLENLGLTDIKEMNAPDNRVPCGHRPNLAAVLPGKSGRTLWVIGHMDVVPPGDPDLWNSDPYQLKVEEDVLTGRGVEDNHQAIVSALILARGLLKEKITPDFALGLLFVSDEETGSAYGLEYVLANHGALFSKDDLFLVPDFGSPDSEMVEVAEKSMCWVKIRVEGKQCHASTPGEGINAFRAASDMVVRLNALHEAFSQSDPLFDPPTSTFEPTKSEANVENVNTIPGRAVFYVDCRILPGIPVDDVLTEMERICGRAAKEHGVTVDCNAVHREDSAPPTPENSEVVVSLLSAIRAVYDNDPKPKGIGGGTVAALLRKRGYPTAVWATCMHNAHQPNEKTTLSNLMGDAKVFARMLFE